MTAPEEHMQLAAWLRNPWQKCDDTPRGPIPEWQAALMFEAANVIDGYSRSAVITQAAVAAAYEAAAQAIEKEASDIRLARAVAYRMEDDAAKKTAGLILGSLGRTSNAIRALATPDQIAALAAERAATVMVNPLVWKIQSAACQIADTPWGCVAVQDESHALAPKRWGWWMVGSGEDDEPSGYGTSIEEAQAAAQADYDARIRAAITITSGAAPDTTPLPRAEVEALMEAAQLVSDWDEWALQIGGVCPDRLVGCLGKMRLSLATLQERMK